MRNDSGQVLRDVEDGQRFTVTRRGAPVAQIVPIEETNTRFRPARKPAVFDVTELVRSSISSEDVIAELRDD